MAGKKSLRGAKQTYPVWAALLAITALGLLITAVLLLLIYFDASDSASRFRTATICTSALTFDCWEQESVAVMDIGTTGGRNPRQMLTVAFRDGREVELVDSERTGLPFELSVESQVEAKLWQGEVVALYSAGGRSMITQYHPAWRSKDNLTAAIVAAVAAPIFAILASIAWQGTQWNRKRNEIAPLKRRRSKDIGGDV